MRGVQKAVVPCRLAVPEESTRQKATPLLFDGIPLKSVEMVIDCAYRGSCCDVGMKHAPSDGTPTAYNIGVETLHTFTNTHVRNPAL